VYLDQSRTAAGGGVYWKLAHLDIGISTIADVAWLIRMGTAVFGQSQFGVPRGGFVLRGDYLVFVYRLRATFSDEATALAAWYCAGSAYFFFSGLLMTPDAPLAAAWAPRPISQRALVAGRSAAGGARARAGIGAISKYSIGLLFR